MNSEQLQSEAEVHYITTEDELSAILANADDTSTVIIINEAIESNEPASTLNHDHEIQENTVQITDTIDNQNKRSRKRTADTNSWKQNIRKRRRQSGLEYVEFTGKKKRKREIQTSMKDCSGKCKFKCNKISKEERQSIFNLFWSYTDSEKSAFYASYVEKKEKCRTRTTNENSKRKFSYAYYLSPKSEKVRVCKDFFLHTLDISARRIQWFFEKKFPTFQDKRGKHTKKKVSEEAKAYIREHISSFPKVESHYCRANTKREYLEPCLTLSKMYELYVFSCNTNNISPEKIHTYRNIFNKEFNLGFHIPKKDRCDICEEYKASANIAQISTELRQKYEAHIIGKTQTKEERDRDRSSNKAVLCFDMENVLSCPRANISNFFYKRKLSVYNLTAHLSTNKKAYNAIWSEHQAGRGANEIASALLKILEKVMVDYPTLETLTLWSDSCIPQNRNSIMSTALQHFLQNSSSLKQIEHKYCEPGHSSIQEVDAIHSQIEKSLSLSEVFSPVSLLRVLSKVKKRSMCIIQMQSDHFYNFQLASQSYKFNCIPFTKVKHLKYDRVKPLEVAYKDSLLSDFQNVSILAQSTRKKGSKFIAPKICNLVPKANALSKEKVKDLKDMLKYMPLDDRKYYQAIFKNYK